MLFVKRKVGLSVVIGSRLEAEPSAVGGWRQYIKVQGSAQPPAKKTAGQIEKETLWFCISCYWIVGAVFNRDYPGNRGQRPLPPTINYSLNDIEFYAVSYECSRWPKNGQFNQKITTFL